MNKHSQTSDIELLRLLQLNEVDAFEGIYLRYWYKLYVTANKRLRNKEASEEIVQNLFTKFWTNRKGLNITSSLSAYLFASVRYAIFDHLEKEATQKNLLFFAHYNHAELDNSTEEGFYFQELELTIAREIEKLPTRCKSVFDLSRKEYKSNKEIAMHLNISEKTVENHITNAIRMIKTGLKKSFVLAVIFLSLFWQ